MLGTEIENISLDFCCNRKATRAADIGRNYMGLYCNNFRQKLGRLPLPLEGYLDDTYFRTTNEGLSHPEYFLIKGFLPKAPTKELGAGPYSTIKIPVCSGGLPKCTQKAYILDQVNIRDIFWVQDGCKQVLLYICTFYTSKIQVRGFGAQSTSAICLKRARSTALP